MPRQNRRDWLSPLSATAPRFIISDPPLVPASLVLCKMLRSPLPDSERRIAGLIKLPTVGTEKINELQGAPGRERTKCQQQLLTGLRDDGSNRSHGEPKLGVAGKYYHWLSCQGSYSLQHWAPSAPSRLSIMDGVPDRTLVPWL